MFQELVHFFGCQVLVQLITCQHAGRIVACSETLAKFERQPAILGRFARTDVRLAAHVVEDLFATVQGTTDRTANPSPSFSVRLVLFEESIKRQRVLDFGWREFEQLGHLDHRLQGHMPQVVVDHMQRRQRDRLLGRIARKERLDLRDHLVGQYLFGRCHVTSYAPDSNKPQAKALRR